MVAISALDRTIQLAPEVTPGTPPATGFKKLTAISVAPAPNIPTNRYRPEYQELDTAVIPGKEHSTSDVSGKMCYRHVAYVLSSVFGPATITTPVGATTARQWAWAPTPAAPGTPKTFTAERLRGGAGVRNAYGLFTGFGMNITREDAEMSSAWISQKTETGITLTAGATALQDQLMVPTSWNVYLDSTAGGVGTTKLTTPFSAEFSYDDRWGPLFFLNAAQQSYGDIVRQPPDASLTLTTLLNASTDALVDVLRAGGTRFVRIESVGPEIETGHPFLFQLDCAMKFEELGGEDEEDGALATDLVGRLVIDETFGKLVNVKLVTDIQAL